MEPITQQAIDFMAQQFKALGLKSNRSKRMWTDDLGYCFSTFHIRIPSCGVGLFIDNGITMLWENPEHVYYTYSKLWHGRVFLENDPYACLTANSPEWLMANEYARRDLAAEIQDTVEHYRKMRDYQTTRDYFGRLYQDAKMRAYFPKCELHYSLALFMLGNTKEAISIWQSSPHPVTSELLALGSEEKMKEHMRDVVSERRIAFKRYLNNNVEYSLII